VVGLEIYNSLPSRIVLNLPLFGSFDFLVFIRLLKRSVFCLDKIGSVA
jgi:hypothetical protein